MEFDEDEYFDLPRFGKYNSVEVKPLGHRISEYDRSIMKPLKIERDPSQNERYRDYSPGDVQIKTPSIPFSGMNLKQAHNMFDHNQKLAQNRYKQNDISQKYRIDSQIQSNKKNAYHLKQNQSVTGTESRLGAKRGKQGRAIDTSNYVLKSMNNSRRVLKNKQTLLKPSIDAPELMPHQGKRTKHNRNDYRMQGTLTYSKVHSENQQALLKQQIFSHYANAHLSMPFHKKYEDMETQSNPAIFNQKYTPGNEDFRLYDKTLERQISDFGHHERYESGDRSMVSGCSAKTLNTANTGFGKPKYRTQRNKSNLRNNSINRHTLEKFTTGLTDLSDRENKGPLGDFQHKGTHSKTYMDYENYSNRVDTDNSDLTCQTPKLQK